MSWRPTLAFAGQEDGLFETSEHKRERGLLLVWIKNGTDQIMVTYSIVAHKFAKKKKNCKKKHYRLERNINKKGYL